MITNDNNISDKGIPATGAGVDSLGSEGSLVSSSEAIESSKAADTPQSDVDKTKGDNPDPPIKIKAAVDYFKSIYTASGRDFNEDQLYKYAKRKDLKTFIRKFHVITGNIKTMPTEKQADSIYNSWLDTTPIVEKKNQDVSGVIRPASSQLSTDSGLQSTSTDGKPTLVSPGVISMTEEDAANKNNEYINFQGPVKLGASTQKDPFKRAFFAEIKGSGAMLDTRGYIENVVKAIPRSVMNFNENDARVLISEYLRPYGYKVTEAELGKNVINVLKPDGTTSRLRLFTDLYKLQLSNAGESEFDIEKKENENFDEFLESIYNESGGQFIDQLADVYQTSENLVEDIRKTSSLYVSLNQQQLNLLSIYSGQDVSSFYSNENVFNAESALQTIVKIRKTLRDRSQAQEYMDVGLNQETNPVQRDQTGGVSQGRFGTGQISLNEGIAGLPRRTTQKTNKEIVKEVNVRLDKMILDMRSKADQVSSVIGSGLLVSGSYRNIDLRDENQILALNESGLLLTDIPSDGILIDGKPSSFNTLQDILTDPTTRDDIIRNKLSIEVGDEDAYGYLGQYIKYAKKLIERNEAYSTDGDSVLRPDLIIASEWVEDLFQGIFLEAGQIFTNAGVGLSDVIQMTSETFDLGISRRQADNMVFGTYGLPSSPRLLRPEEIRAIKDEALPLWNTDIFDATGFGSLLQLANQPLAVSTPYFASFAVNPAFGLFVQGVSSYGRNLTEMEQRQAELKRQYDSGEFLSSTEKETLEMDKASARWLSLARAGSEVAITRLFTYNYFKAARAARNFAGARTTDNSRKIATEWVRQHRKGVFGSYSNLFGREFTRAAVREVPEENLILFMDKSIKDAWGIEKFEFTMEDFGRTSFHTMFSSFSMSKFANIGKNKRVDRAVDNQLRNNINVPGFKNAQDAYLINEKEIQEAEQRLGDEFVEGNPDFDALMEQESQLRAELLFGNARKQIVVDQMTVQDKTVFLETIVKLNEQMEVLESTDKNNTVKRKSIEKNIPALQSKLNEILAKYPTELGYFYTDKQVRSDLDNKAARALQLEFEKEGIENYEINNEMIVNKAMKLYVEAVRDNDIQSAEKFLPAEAYTVTDPSVYLRTITDDEINDFDLISNIEKAYEGIANNQAAPAAQETQASPDTSTTTSFTPVPASEFKIDADRVDDANSILERISNYNKDNDFLNNLSKNAQSDVIRFFESLKANRNPAYDRITSLLNAYEIAIETSSLTPGGVDIYNYKSNPEKTVGENLFGKLNTAGQKLVTVKFGFGTGDILLKTLFRDQNQGKPFVNLFQGIQRKIAEQTEKYDGLKTSAFKKYRADVIAENKRKSPADRSDPNILGLYNSYEIGVAMGFFRKSGVDVEGVDVEFSRWKSLVEQQISRYESEYESINSQKPVSKSDSEIVQNKLNNLKKVYNNLNIENAKNYDELNISQATRNFISDLAAVQPGQAALRRIRGFGGDTSNKEMGTTQPFLDGSYVPISFHNTSETVSGSRNSVDSGVSINDASHLKPINFPEVLPDNMELNLGLSARNAYSNTKGAAIDTEARIDNTTMEYLLENKMFENTFNSKNDFNSIKNYFKTKAKEFNTIVNEGSDAYVDFGSMSNSNDFFKQLRSKTERAGYSLLSAQVLTSVPQRFSQFYSALSGTAPYLKSQKARQYLNTQGVKFIFGLTSVTSGTKKSTKIGKIAQESFLGRGDMSNIFSKSRTGMRNSLNAQFALGDNVSIPAEYYLKFLKIQDEDGSIIAGMSAQYTINQFMDLVSSTSELSLKLFLASADQSASNTAFVAHYIDKRVEQGEKLDGVNMTNWFKSENQNPNIDAINYADGLIAQTMRQTEKTSESKIYSNANNQTLVRLLYPYQKFISNARANFANQVSILNDPKVPESQKAEARAAMKGVVREVVSFNAIKAAAHVTYLKGFAIGILGYGLDDDDVKRYRGMTQVVGTVAPIEDRPGVLETVLDMGSDNSYKDARSNIPTEQKSTKEGQFISGKTDVYSLTNAAIAIEQFSRTYQDKFSVSKEPKNMMRILQDLTVSLQGVPLPNGTEDLIFHGMNEFLGDQGITQDPFFNEYISRDLKTTETKGGLVNFVVENAGIIGIGVESVNKLKEAWDLKENMEVYEYAGEYGENVSYVSGGVSEEMSNRLESSVQTLWYLRLMATLSPGPRADFNKLANYLQRAIQTEFKSSKPDLNVDFKD